MYRALYRKWRPSTFEEMVGQPHITRTLQRQVETGRLSHAYLFTGTRGTGKTSSAKILAKAVNCEHPQEGNPCNGCATCQGIQEGSILDVLELDAASNSGVDQVRALREEATYPPVNGKMRVYIIDEVHSLSGPAMNALLKILEEPPPHLLFILATTELHKIPATIRSRCQQFSFQRILPGEIQLHLCQVAREEGIPLTPEGATLLSRMADGGLRDALSLLDQCSEGEVIDEAHIYQVMGLAGNGDTAKLLTHIGRGHTEPALTLLGELYQKGRDIAVILEELAVLVRDLLLLKTAPRNGQALLTGGYDSATLQQLGQLIAPSQLLYALTLIQRSGADLKQSKNRRTDGELCVIRLCHPDWDPDLLALSNRVAQLEAGGSVAGPAPEITPSPVMQMPVVPVVQAFSEVPTAPLIQAVPPGSVQPEILPHTTAGPVPPTAPPVPPAPVLEQTPPEVPLPEVAPDLEASPALEQSSHVPDLEAPAQEDPAELPPEVPAQAVAAPGEDEAPALETVPETATPEDGPVQEAAAAESQEPGPQPEDVVSAESQAKDLSEGETAQEAEGSAPEMEAAPVSPEPVPVAEAAPVSPEPGPEMEAAPVSPEPVPVAEVAPVSPEPVPVAEAAPISPEPVPVAEAASVSPEPVPVAEAAPISPEPAPVMSAPVPPPVETPPPVWAEDGPPPPWMDEPPPEEAGLPWEVQADLLQPSPVAEPVPVGVAPAPVTPAPVAPAPVAPTPVAPAPVAPAPVAPAPVAPTPVAAPVPAAAPATQAQGDFWPAFAEGLKGRINQAGIPYLTNPEKVLGRFENGTLTLWANSNFTKAIIDRPYITEALVSIAQDQFQQPVTLAFRLGSPPPLPPSAVPVAVPPPPIPATAEAPAVVPPAPEPSNIPEEIHNEPLGEGPEADPLEDLMALEEELNQGNP